MLLCAAAVTPGGVVSAQPAVPNTAIPVSQAAFRSTGNGNVTWVLISGLVGGVTGFRALETLLLREGHRVVVIDPFALSIDSADVSFAALARTVTGILIRERMTNVRIVGHSSGAGVALRVAAFAPERVEALYFLDAGAMESNRGPVLSRSLRLAPLIAHLPGGRSFLRDKIVAGIRESAVQCEWFDSAAQHAYADPMISEIGRVVALANRLGNTNEPDSLAKVIERVHSPVTVLLGGAPHASHPSRGELDALALLGAQLTIVSLPGVGHFPHEEAPALVASELLRNVSSGRLLGATP